MSSVTLNHRPNMLHESPGNGWFASKMADTALNSSGGSDGIDGLITLMIGISDEEEIATMSAAKE